MEGFSSGFANFIPEPELHLAELALERSWERTVELQRLLADLERARSASDDAASVKSLMDAAGLRGGAVRPPRLAVEASAHDAHGGLLDEALAAWEAFRARGAIAGEPRRA